MSYRLGIDLGTGRTVAAVARECPEGAGEQVPAVPEIVTLGPGPPGVPTVLHLADDETMLVGIAAQRLALSDPDRVFHSFLHRVGEPPESEPRHEPAVLTARLVRWVVDTVRATHGGPATRITLAHPTGWGAAERRAVQQALAAFGLPDVTLLPAALTAAISYTATGPQRVRAGQLIAIYDLGETFAGSVAYQGGAEVALLGTPQILLDGGGRQFDELVLARVLHKLGDKLGDEPGHEPGTAGAALDLEDPSVLAASAQLLADCVAARESLDHRTEVTIPVTLPGLRTEIGFTRDELHLLIAPTLQATMTALHSAIAVAGVTAADVSAVLLTGGCASMPQLARLLTTEFGRPVTTLPEPALAAARGAAYGAPHRDCAPDTVC